MDEIIEEWKPICGYEGLYEVSNMGQVKSLGNDKTRKEKILKQGKYKDGYFYVCLSKENNQNKINVHRLVANAFIPNPNNFRCVNHKDEDKTNNCVENLEWCDVAYNNTYGNRLKKVAEKKSKKVYQYDKNGTLVAIHHSTREAGRQGFNQGAVAACCRGELKLYKNYLWSYEEIKKEQGN